MELGSGVALQLLKGGVDRTGGMVGPLACHGVEGFRDRQDRRSDRNLAAPQAVRVAVAIVVLMVVPHDGHQIPERSGFVENRCAERDVRHHDRPLRRIKSSGLAQNSIGNTDLAHIVQQPGQAYLLNVLWRQLQLAGDHRGQVSNVFGVPVRVGVFGIDGSRQRGD